jgi:multicomponent Na+:H+ antiporter subunit F
MIGIFSAAAIIVLLLTLPFIYRAIRGPTLYDRVVALNGIGTIVPVMMILIGLMYDRVDMFVDIALAIFLLNLFTTLLIGRYVRDMAEAADRAESAGPR